MTHPLSRPRRLFPRLLLIAVAGLLLAIAICGTFLSSRESRAVGRAVVDWVERTESGEVVEAEFRVVSTEGLPKELADRSAKLQWQSPDKLFLETTIDEEPVLAGREGETIWIQLLRKEFTVIGDNRVPRFSGDPGSIEVVNLPDFAIPVPSWKLQLLPFLLSVTTETDPEGGADWQRIVPSQMGRDHFGLPDFQIDSRRNGGEVRELRLTLTNAKSLTLRVDRFEFRDGSLPEPAWSAPGAALASADRVALSHLVRAARVVASQLGAKTPPLPPVTGEHIAMATSGKGRLELHDGVRVLFLEGSPMEMGRQQGELLRDEVRAVVDRIVYGVGVGSSFGKGRWFFGEIEEAQSRIEPFIPASHLSEMDAIAEAAGLHRQESRLANFFPELFHCSGFALHGSATADGRMYHGRILDYIRGAGLEDNAVVTVCQPIDGKAWVNISYAGFIGSVTAMNEEHLAIGEMGGRGEGNWDGKPMAQLVREVMESCGTIDEAVDLMRKGPRTCEYYYVISDGKSGRAVGIKATPDLFETVWSGESHPQLPDPVADTVLLSADERYTELVRRVKKGFGSFDADSARELMTSPVCMNSNIQSVLFAPGSLDFWIANADSENVASHTRYTKFNLAELLAAPGKLTLHP